MKRISTLLSTVALAALPFGAFGADLTLSPADGDSDFFSLRVCGGTAPIPCPNPGVLEDTVTFTVEFVTPGIENASATASITPNASGAFTIFEWVLRDPSDIEIAHGSNFGTDQQPTDIAVGPGGEYTYEVHYRFVSGQNTDSAGWAMVLTTGPATDTPEPATLALIAMGLLGAGLARRRKQ